MEIMQSPNSTIENVMQSLNMKVYLLFVFIQIRVTSSTLVISNTKSCETKKQYQNSLKSCITPIAEKYIPCGTPITLMFSSDDYTESITRFLSNRNCYTFITRSIKTKRWVLSTNVYIFYVENYEEFSLTFSMLSRDSAWNPRAYFIVIIKDLDQSEYAEVFKVLLKLNIFNVLMISISENRDFKLYTYYPFSNGSCGQSVKELVNIKNCTDISLIRTDYKYVENKFRNCIIRVAANEDVPNFIFESNKDFSYLGKEEKGIEQYILANIAEREKFELNYVYADDEIGHGVVLSNYTITGILGYLQNDTVDVVTGGFLMLRNRVKLFEYVWGYNYGDLYIFTPAWHDNNWKKVFHEFSATSWILIFLSYFLVTFSIVTIRWYLLNKTDKIKTALATWGYLYGHVDAKLFKTKKLRMIMIMWIWFTFFITNFYTTAFYSLLTGKVKVKLYIDTKSLKSLPLKPCISNSMRTFFRYSYRDKLIANDNINCEDSDGTLETVANSEEYFTIEMKHKYYMTKYKYIDEDGNNKLEDLLYTSGLVFAMYTKRGFPLRQKFQRYAAYHFETGLLKRQEEALYLKYLKLKHNNNIHSFKKVRVSDLRIHFAVLFVGYIISSMSFIAEKRIYRRKKRIV